MTVEREAIVVRPCYRQFYLRRGDADWSSDCVSENGHERGLEAIDGFVYVGTTRYGSPTQVVVEVHDADQGSDEVAGGNGKDIVVGGTGADILSGRPRQDIVVGNSVTDIIDGGHGPDRCTNGERNTRCEFDL